MTNSITNQCPTKWKKHMTTGKMEVQSTVTGHNIPKVYFTWDTLDYNCQKMKR